MCCARARAKRLHLKPSYEGDILSGKEQKEVGGIRSEIEERNTPEERANIGKMEPKLCTGVDI